MKRAVKITFLAFFVLAAILVWRTVQKNTPHFAHWADGSNAFSGIKIKSFHSQQNHADDDILLLYGTFGDGDNLIYNLKSGRPLGQVKNASPVAYFGSQVLCMQHFEPTRRMAKIQIWLSVHTKRIISYPQSVNQFWLFDLERNTARRVGNIRGLSAAIPLCEVSPNSQRCLLTSELGQSLWPGCWLDLQARQIRNVKLQNLPGPFESIPNGWWDATHFLLVSRKIGISPESDIFLYDTIESKASLLVRSVTIKKSLRDLHPELLDTWQFVVPHWNGRKMDFYMREGVHERTNQVCLPITRPDGQLIWSERYYPWREGGLLDPGARNYVSYAPATNGHSQSGLAVFDLTSGAEHVLVPPDETKSRPSFHICGREVYYVNDEGALWKTSIDGGRREQVFPPISNPR